MFSSKFQDKLCVDTCTELKAAECEGLALFPAEFGYRTKHADVSCTMSCSLSMRVEIKRDMKRSNWAAIWAARGQFVYRHDNRPFLSCEGSGPPD